MKKDEETNPKVEENPSLLDGNSRKGILSEKLIVEWKYRKSICGKSNENEKFNRRVNL